MSNIPEARKILKDALEAWNRREDDGIGGSLEMALGLLDRKKPAFIAKCTTLPLNDTQKAQARSLRAAGKSMNAIARVFGVNLGRVSEAVNA